MNARKISLGSSWTLANTAGIVVSHLVTTAVILLSLTRLEEEASLVTILVVPGVAGGTAGSVVSGILQWLVLLPYTSRTARSRAARWVSIGAAGFAVGYAVTVVLTDLVFFLSVLLSYTFVYSRLSPYVMIAFNRGAVAGCVIGAGVGAVIGAVQGTVQCDLWRRHGPRSGRWISTSIVKLIIELIASGIGAPVAFVIAEAIYTGPSDALPDPGTPIVIGCLSIVAGGLLSGVITGRALTRLLQSPAKTPAPEKDTTSPPQDELPR